MKWSLGLRVGASVLLLVGVTLALSWTVTQRVLVRPFSQELRLAFFDQALHVARQAHQGAELAELEEALGLELELLPAQGRRPPVAVRDWQPVEHRGHRLLVRRAEGRGEALVRVPGGWVRVARTLDLEGPPRLLVRGLVLVGILVVLVTWTLTRMAGRPLEEAAGAMARIAAADLRHRLPERGAPELRSAARSFNAMADRVEAMLETERRLMAGLSHELRTPLTRLRLELELLREGLSSEERLDAMEGDLAELDLLVGEMLASSRLQLGEGRLQRVPVDLHAVAARAIEAVPLPEHEVVLSGGGETVSADPRQLERVLANLLQNAGKYAPGGTRIEVRVEGRSVEVADEGPGVPEEALPRLFEPFFRVDRSRSRGTGGVGLGLMIARQVVELHGGEIAASNRREGGLLVRLALPAEGPDTG